MEIIIKLANGRCVRVVLPEGSTVSPDQLSVLMKWAREGKPATLALD